MHHLKIICSLASHRFMTWGWMRTNLRWCSLPPCSALQTLLTSILPRTRSATLRMGPLLDRPTYRFAARNTNLILFIYLFISHLEIKFVLLHFLVCIGKKGNSFFPPLHFPMWQYPYIVWLNRFPVFYFFICKYIMKQIRNEKTQSY